MPTRERVFVAQELRTTADLETFWKCTTADCTLESRNQHPLFNKVPGSVTHSIFKSPSAKQTRLGTRWLWVGYRLLFQHCGFRQVIQSLELISWFSDPSSINLITFHLPCHQNKVPGKTMFQNVLMLVLFFQQFLYVCICMYIYACIYIHIYIFHVYNSIIP